MKIIKIALFLFCTPALLFSQQFPTNDPVLKSIWEQGMENSHLYGMSQVLADSLGPRLTGTPQQMAAVDWAVNKFESWGIRAEKESYGTWMSWNRGVSHIDLVAPRVRSLEGTLLAWSPGTNGVKEGGAILLPEVDGADAFKAWLPNARGKYVLLSVAEESCRPADVWADVGRTGAEDAFNQKRTEARNAWNARIDAIGMERQEIMDALENAGAAGFLTNYWTGARGSERIFPMTYSFRAMNRKAPGFNLSCEDYGLVYRLVENGDMPKLRATAEAEYLGEVPVHNVIATIPGSELPDEYVLLSAHYDSWDGASGMTDNGTGSVTMMEAMRIIKEVFPNPKRTIIAGLWNSEEQGLNGSRAYANDHPEVVEGMQALFNQDNGTGRISSISMQGMVGAGAFFGDWFSQIPGELTSDIDLSFPGSPGSGGTDNASFTCFGTPAFSLGSHRMDYFNATWHTNRDTFDKIAWDDLKGNATLTAMLVYLAAQDDRIPRDKRDMGLDREGNPRGWPECSDGARETMDRFK